MAPVSRHFGIYSRYPDTGQRDAGERLERYPVLGDGSLRRLLSSVKNQSLTPWARMAAEGAACAQLQSADSFWMLHDQLFEHQQEITAENVKAKLIQYAENTKRLDMTALKACMNDELSLGLVFRDMNLASGNDVQSTPTLFINGHRVPGVRDADQLRQLIEEAKNEARAARETQARAGGSPARDAQ